MRYSKYSGRGNFFSLPNEVFLLGLSAGELSVYSFLKRCENRKTHQCWPSTGLRRGEICGLMWQDFDEAHGTLTVRRTIHAERGGRLTAGETKTGAGKRIITLPPSTAQLLSERRKRSYTEWIFPDPLRPERPTRPNAAYVRMKELLKKAGLPSIRFHDLRHTFATHALASGVDAKTLSGILGHTQASFTLDTYTHVTGDMQKRASEIVGGFMENIMVR